MPKALPFCALSYGLSVLLGNWLAVRQQTAAVSMTVALACLAIAWWHRGLLGLSLLGLFAATGLWAQSQRPQPPQSSEFRELLTLEGRAEPVTISAMIRDAVRPTANAHLLPLTIFAVHRSDGGGGCLDQPARGTLRLSGLPTDTAWPGDLIRVRTVLRATSLDDDHRDDREQTVQADALTGSAHANDLVRYHPIQNADCQPPLSDRMTWLWRRPIERFRHHLRHQITMLDGSPETKAVLIALCLGWRGDLAEVDRWRRDSSQPTITSTFTDAGIAHILSVSGLHLALVGWLLYRALASLLRCWPWLAQRWATQRLAAALATPLVLGYTLLTGAESPTVRAACVLLLWIGAVAVGRRSDLAHGLALAVLCTGLPIPEGGARRLIEPSWLLSMAATLGLSYVRPLDGWWPSLRSPAMRHWYTPLVTGLHRALSATIGATLATAPLGALFFGRFVATGLLANLLVVPIGELVVLPLGLGGLLLRLACPSVGELVLRLALRGTSVLLWLTSQFAALGLAWTVPAPPLAWLLLFAVGLLLAALRVRWGYALCLLSAFLYVIDWQRPKAELRLTALSVGQGDSLLVELPSRQVLVVDAGPASEDGHDAGLSVITPYLRQRGIRQIDWLVVTHGHPDHTGGIRTLLQEFAVKELWLPPLPGPSRDGITAQQRRERQSAEASFSQLREVAASRHTRVMSPHSLQAGDVAIDLLSPLPDRTLSLNDGSVVLRLRYAGRSLLLTGDIERTGEALLLASGSELRSDVLKAPHHCSRTSSTEPFVAAVAPKLVICSVGRHNRFGFPHPSVVERYQQAHSHILRTDQLGSIVIRLSSTGRLAVVRSNTPRFFF